MIENIRTVLELLSQLYCLSYLYGKKMRYNVYSILLIITQFIIILGINEYYLSPKFINIAYIAILLYCIVNYETNLRKAFINCILSCSVVAFLELFYFIVISTMFYHNKVNILVELLIMIFTILSILLIGRKNKLYQLSNLLLKKTVFRLILIVFTIGFVGSCIYKVKVQGVLLEKDYISIICFFIILFGLFNEWQKLRSEIEKNKIEMNINSLYYSTL